MNDPCPNCGVIDYEKECGFCALSKENKKHINNLEEKDEIIRLLVHTLYNAGLDMGDHFKYKNEINQILGVKNDK